MLWLGYIYIIEEFDNRYSNKRHLQTLKVAADYLADLRLPVSSVRLDVSLASWPSIHMPTPFTYTAPLLTLVAAGTMRQR